MIPDQLDVMMSDRAARKYLLNCMIPNQLDVMMSDLRCVEILS